MATKIVKSVFRSNLFLGNIAIITGGGTGIGKSIAKELSVLGCKVVIASRKPRVLEECARVLNSELCEELVFPFPCNIRKEDEVKNLMHYTVSKFGKLDFLINNGGGQFISPFSEINTKGWNAVVDTNLNGTYYCLREAYHAWMGKNGGSIVNIVVSNFNGMPGMSHSAAARAGIINLTQTLALEWAENGIRINAIAPGCIYSESAAANYQNYPNLFKDVVNLIPLKRTGTVEEVSALVCFLLSPAASFITGDILKIDGAQSLHRHSFYEPKDHTNSKPFTWQGVPFQPSKL
ncbi:peroxisomal trans-2-enoyl-CoA reductase isoform X2 [Hydra vulgaris]|uniref:Peroxisomal trans-2-enoyl-CoA reductase n=1 Tax=Hydra vulgaris TaxID=6087 RepID=A0ABM4CXU4_HYDVU